MAEKDKDTSPDERPRASMEWVALTPRAAMPDADRDFLAAARLGDDEGGMRLLAQGADVNARDQTTFLSALHYAAGCRAWRFIRMMESVQSLDFLQKDRKGRLASALAFEVAKDPELGEYLLEREIGQAEANGLSYPDYLTDKQVPAGS